MIGDESLTPDSSSKLTLNRPEPILSDIDIVPFNRRMAPQYAVEALVEGYFVLITDSYSSGLDVLNELKKYVKKAKPDQSFQGQRAFRTLFRELSHRLLLHIGNHKLTVKKAPTIGWLKILYPELNEFLLAFSQVQGLNSAWQWFEKGIIIPGLERKIHPFYGTYFPTRFEHIELFDTWLKHYQGDKTSAIDIGIGSGVLSFLLLRHGFNNIYGTDTNPNAIFGLDEYLKKKNLHSQIELSFGDLFNNRDLKTELILFNPPWIPASHDMDLIDQAIYYPSGLFPQFFKEAKKRLKPKGKIVLIFSNLAQITGVCDHHPIETELAQGGRFTIESLTKLQVKAASKHNLRDRNWRESEKVELWVLKSIAEE
ncbi:MAG: methyltransferase [Bacteroidales bacterium]|nr:methyltransferase [Bacteroidales bacterium]